MLITILQYYYIISINSIIISILCSIYLLTILFGDWGLGIGDWAIPNPQSPIPKFKTIFR